MSGALMNLVQIANLEWEEEEEEEEAQRKFKRHSSRCTHTDAD